MGQAASGQASNALTSIRVLFLDMDNPVAYKLTAGLLHKHSEVTVVLATEDNVAVEVNRADVIVTIEAPLSKGVIARAAVLKLICQFGNDVSRIDLQAAAAANISVTHIPSKDAGIAESSAEHAIGLAFSVLRPRSVPSARGSIGKNLCGMTAVVVGNGGIGQRLTFLLQAMGSDASCVDPSNVDLLEEIGNADILFFCCAVTEKLKKLVNLQFLTSTKEGAYIVSISRVSHEYILCHVGLILCF